MKVAIIGTFSGRRDEGFKNIAFELADQVAKHGPVLRLDNADLFSLQFWRDLREFQPDILHYITGPTLSSLIVLKLAKILLNNHPRTVASSLYHHIYTLTDSPAARILLRTFRPDMLLVQSGEVHSKMAGLHINAELLPNGVNRERFHPVSRERKEALRKQYDLPKDASILLHVGHVNPKRGLSLFFPIRREIPECEVLIIGSAHFQTDQELVQSLKDCGCRVYLDHFERIEELYQLSDCYIFPPSDTIFMPLSILEALSTNIPVVSEKFEGLSTFFEEANGLTFAHDPEEFIEAIHRMMNGDDVVNTRQFIESCSWDDIGKRLVEKYTHILKE